MTEEQLATPPAAPRKGRRVGMGILLGCVMATLIFTGGWVWTGAVLFTLYQGFRELTSIMKAKDIRPSQLIVLTTGIALILLAHFDKTQYFLPMITLGIIGSFIRLLFRKPRATINDIGATFLAIFYVAFLPMHFILLRNVSAEGAYYVFFTVLVISMSDVGAYYVGKLMGRHPLYPEISPKKTTEGAIGGLVVGIIAGTGFAFLAYFNWLHALLLSVLLVVVSQLGDLAESLIKRDAGVKDSGGLFQGHGGLLDRLDSYLFCGAISYYYIHWVVLQQGLVKDLLPLFT